MPLPVAHGLLGASVVAALHPRPTRRRYTLALVAGALLANAADLDFVLVSATHSKAWHRGFTHSIAFALVVCVLFVLSLGRRRVKEAVAYGVAYGSHGILDYITSKEGGGVELWWPFSAERLICGWWGLSEVPSKLTSLEILRALLIEGALFTPLLLVVLLLKRALPRRTNPTAGAT